MPAFLDRSGHKHELRSQDEVSLYDGERIPIHSDLQQILKDFTKAVMNGHPSDVIAFSADYFKTRAMQGRQARALGGDKQGGSALALKAGRAYRGLPVDMQERIEQIFLAFDADESGFINRSEFYEMLKQVGAFFKFECTQAEADEVLKMIDTNNDRQLSWQEFSSALVSWVTDKGFA